MAERAFHGDTVATRADHLVISTFAVSSERESRTVGCDCTTGPNTRATAAGAIAGILAPTTIWTRVQPGRGPLP